MKTQINCSHFSPNKVLATAIIIIITTTTKEFIMDSMANVKNFFVLICFKYVMQMDVSFKLILILNCWQRVYSLAFLPSEKVKMFLSQLLNPPKT